MYVPPHFNETDLSKLHQVMRENSFATLVTMDNGAPFATHIPILIDPNRGQYGTLRGHVARANPQWTHWASGAEALVIFQGPHAYISPNWYASGMQVPTWNYSAVHAYGTVRPIEDPVEFRAILDASVDFYEAASPTPWSTRVLPDEFVLKLMKAIVGFEIEITRLEGKFKMSQNRTISDQLSAIEGLMQTPDPLSHQVAQWMTQHAAELAGKD